MDVLWFIIGCLLCFFGGMYPTLFAAFQAAKHSGLMTLKQSIIDLSDEALVITEESKKDDKQDFDSDGVSDVNEIDSKEYILRKTKLILTKMNPVKVDNALNRMYTVWIAVIATLKIKFARTIALSLVISDFLARPAKIYVTPHIQHAVPKEYQRWVPVIISWITKSVGMSVAWFLQTIISAVTSAIDGGLIMSRSLLKICVEKEMNFGGLIPKDYSKTHIDETIAYAFATMGFIFQTYHWFDMPFPFNILFFPVGIAEYYIRWTVTD